MYGGKIPKCLRRPNPVIAIDRKKVGHFELGLMTLFFKFVGVWITSRRLSLKQAFLRHLGLTWVLLSLVAIFFMVYKMSHDFDFQKDKVRPLSITQMMRTVLLFLDICAHLYCFTLLRKYESNLVEFTRCSPLRCKYVRLLRYMAITQPILRVVMQGIHEWQSPDKPSYSEVIMQAVFSPLRIAYDLSMVLYLMAAVSLCDYVQDFKDSVDAHVKEHGVVDLLWICRKAVMLKYSVRAKVSRINSVFSFPILVLYFKLFSYYLLFIYVGVIASSKQQRHVEAIVFIFCGLHSTIEIVVLSSNTMYFIRKLREATDHITDLVLSHDVKHLMLWSEVRRIVDFDSDRDAVMVWDSFVLCKATTVKFFVGMITCVSIILQFDVNFKDALDIIDV